MNILDPSRTTLREPYPRLLN